MDSTLHERKIPLNNNVTLRLVQPSRRIFKIHTLFTRRKDERRSSMFALEDLKRRAVHEALVHAWHKMLAAPVGEA
ncbi:hypothetical protein AKG08_27780 [Achromobacter piechaudii]|nr:hypothetical protein [Achromobacter piechaudii]KNY03933.1 hypothetical protein AKG08_27780 [Achromobacter piechaudii]